MKKYIQSSCNNFSNYDALARRGNVDVDFSFADKNTSKTSTNKDGNMNNLSRQQSFLGGAPGI